MKKYYFIFKATLIESFQYLLNILLGSVTFLIMLFVFISLWKYMYSNSTGLISGYNVKQMIWYVILSETVWFVGRNATITSQMSMDIKSGSIAYSINKPYHYIYYIIAKHMGEIALRFLLYFIIGAIIGCCFIGGIPGFKLYRVPFAMLSFLLGLLISSSISMSISILSFWIEDSRPFQWLYDKMIVVIGILFPLELFPAWAQPVIKASPIYVVTYSPARLMINFDRIMLIKIFSAQILYLLGIFLILNVLFQKGVRKLNVNGG